MPTVLMAIAHIRDWKTVQHFSSEELLNSVQHVGATRSRLHRNLEDASQMLLLVEASYRDDLDEVICRFNRFFDQDVLEISFWEIVLSEGEVS